MKTSDGFDAKYATTYLKKQEIAEIIATERKKVADWLHALNSIAQKRDYSDAAAKEILNEMGDPYILDGFLAHLADLVTQGKHEEYAHSKKQP